MNLHQSPRYKSTWKISMKIRFEMTIFVIFKDVFRQSDSHKHLAAKFFELISWIQCQYSNYRRIHGIKTLFVSWSSHMAFTIYVENMPLSTLYCISWNRIFAFHFDVVSINFLLIFLMGFLARFKPSDVMNSIPNRIKSFDIENLCVYMYISVAF